MKELLNEIQYQIEKYFDRKTKDAKITDETENEIWDKINGLIEDVGDMIEETDKDVDDMIEDEQADHNPSFYEEMHQDQMARQDALYSIDNGYYLTR